MYTCLIHKEMRELGHSRVSPVGHQMLRQTTILMNDGCVSHHILIRAANNGIQFVSWVWKEFPIIRGVGCGSIMTVNIAGPTIFGIT